METTINERDKNRVRHKDTILRRTGGLNDDEMRDVSEIVIRTLERDISLQLEALRFRAEQPAE